MKKQLMWFAIGVIVGTIGMTTLSAGGSGGGWSDRDVFKAISLLEKIAENTAR